MRLGKDLEGKPLISVADGRILGRAKDVFVDPELNNLVGLFVGTEGVIRRRTQVIPSADVVLYGIDVILVKDSEVIVNDKDLPEAKAWQRLKDLQGREVLTPGGTKLGSVGDVILDETGSIIGLHLSRIFVKGPLADQGTIPRETVVNPNREDGSIGVDLSLLEKMVGGVEGEDESDVIIQAKEVPSDADQEEAEDDAEMIPVAVDEKVDDTPILVIEEDTSDGSAEDAADEEE